MRYQSPLILFLHDTTLQAFTPPLIGFPRRQWGGFFVMTRRVSWLMTIASWQTFRTKT